MSRFGPTPLNFLEVVFVTKIGPVLLVIECKLANIYAETIFLDIKMKFGTKILCINSKVRSRLHWQMFSEKTQAVTNMGLKDTLFQCNLT